MAFSVLLAIGGIWYAYRNYVQRPENSEQMAENWSGAHRVLTNKYYVDEAYDATVIRGTMTSANSLWTVDKRVVDGAVNGIGVILTSWARGLRRVQTGAVQNYALAMILGIFVIASLYLLYG